MGKPKIESCLADFDRDRDDCLQGAGDQPNTRSVTTSVASDCPPADDGSRSPSDLEEMPSGKDRYLEAATLLLPTEEPFPVSFLQRRFRIGYLRAIELHEAINNRRAERPPDHRCGDG